MTPPETSALIDWILREATAIDRGEPLVEGLASRLLDAGMPLLRLSLSTPTLHPAMRAVSLNWRRGEGVAFVATDHGEQGEAMFERSPIAYLLEQDVLEARWRLERGDGCEAFPILSELRDAGGTDYRLHLVSFSPGTALVGCAMSYAIDRPGGFTAAELELIAALVPALGMAILRFNLDHVSRNILGAYLGPMTSARVLAGEVRRGRGTVISAVILLADLRGFTTLADGGDPARVVAWLDQHLEALGDAVDGGGGEILKFTGDGFIAVFPVTEAEGRPCAVCRQALGAAEAALAANEALNARRRTQGEPELAVDLVLHYGDVVYGNVGTTRRLDFTTVGRAVNEASRIEALCDALDRHLVLSDSFAERCGRGFVDLGSFPLRGVGVPRRLWGV